MAPGEKWRDRKRFVHGKQLLGVSRIYPRMSPRASPSSCDGCPAVRISQEHKWTRSASKAVTYVMSQGHVSVELPLWQCVSSHLLPAPVALCLRDRRTGRYPKAQRRFQHSITSCHSWWWLNSPRVVKCVHLQNMLSCF